MKSFESDIKKLEQLTAMRFPSDEEKLTRKRLVAYRDRLEALGRSL